MSFVGGRNKSDWIDLHSAEDIELKKGESLIPLGVGMKLQKG